VLAVGGGLVAVGVVVALVLSQHGSNSPTAASSTGSASTSSVASATVGSIVIPSNTATSASPSPSASSASPSASASTANAAATEALATLQTIAQQLTALKQHAPKDTAYQELLGRVNDIERSVVHDEQLTGANAYQDVRDKITAFDQQLAQDVRSRQVGGATAARLAGEMQQVSTDLAAGN
jgi:hypothetical protein